MRVVREAGEMYSESFAPQFLSKFLLKSRSGRRGWIAARHPFGRRQGLYESAACVGATRGQKKHRIGRHEESRNAFDGKVVADLGLSDADDLFFISKIDFDAEPPHVCLQDLFSRKIRVRANEEGRFSIQKAGAFAKSVGKRSHDDKTQVALLTGRSPAHGADGLDLKVMDEAADLGFDGLIRNGMVAEKLRRSRNSVAVDPFASACGLFVRQGMEPGVASNPSDEDSALWQLFQNGLVGVAAIACAP